MGPRLKAGKNVSAPTIKIVETSKIVKSGPVTGKVPRDAGTVFLRARLPEMARIGMTTKNLPKSMAMEVDVLYQRVFAIRPARLSRYSQSRKNRHREFEKVRAARDS